MSTPHAKIRLNLSVWEAKVETLGRNEVLRQFFEEFELLNGTTDGTMCDLVYCKSESAKAAGGTTTYDLVGSLTDIDGATISFVEVCLIAIRNTRATAQAVISIGPDATNGFGVLAGGKGFWNAALGSGGGNVIGPALSTGQTSWTVFYDATGVPCAAGSTDELSVLTSAVTGATNSWDIIIIGRSA